MEDKKREKRKAQAIPVMQPQPLGSIELIGSKDDPCFGKLNSPTASECRQCGDAELCAIVQAQRVARKRIAQGTDFKDIEEPNLDLERLEKFITASLKKVDKLSLKRTQQMVFDHFSKFEKVDRTHSDKMTLDFVIRCPKYKKLKIDGIKYLKIK